MNIEELIDMGDYSYGSEYNFLESTLEAEYIKMLDCLLEIWTHQL